MGPLFYRFFMWINVLSCFGVNVPSGQHHMGQNTREFESGYWKPIFDAVVSRVDVSLLGSHLPYVFTCLSLGTTRGFSLDRDKTKKGMTLSPSVQQHSLCMETKESVLELVRRSWKALANVGEVWRSDREV
eukprot:56269-Amphidinium_carterae.1